MIHATYNGWPGDPPEEAATTLALTTDSYASSYGQPVLVVVASDDPEIAPGTPIDPLSWGLMWSLTLDCEDTSPEEIAALRNMGYPL